MQGKRIALPSSGPWKLRGLRLHWWRPDRFLLLWLPTFLIAGALVMPLAYLFVRAVGADAETWRLILRLETARILLRTLWLAFWVTLVAAIVGVTLAWLTTRTDLPFRKSLAVITVLPLVVPSYVGAYAVVAALGPRGMLQQALERLAGLGSLPEIYGFPGTFLVITLLSYPYILLPVRAALQRMDPALEESSRSLGHGSWSTFRLVTLPQLRPAIAAGAILVALYTLRDFGAVSILRYDTFTRVIYTQYQSLIDRSSSAALALILVILTLAILALDMMTRGKARYYTTSPGKPPQGTRLGVWRWPALAFCFAIVAFSLLLPASVLVYWLLRGIGAGQSLAPLWIAARNSIMASGLAAGATLLAAIPVVILSARMPSRLGRTVERLTYSGFALPGIVIALSLVFFGARYAPSLYQTLPILILAYAILFLPQAIGALRTSILQVEPNLEEAARSLGNRPWQVFRRITLPLIRPGILASVGLVFLTAMKELPATLILGPFGFNTLATEVWSAVTEAFFARAAAPALILILAASIPMAYLILREDDHPL